MIYLRRFKASPEVSVSRQQDSAQPAQHPTRQQPPSPGRRKGRSPQVRPVRLCCCCWTLLLEVNVTVVMYVPCPLG